MSGLDDLIRQPPASDDARRDAQLISRLEAVVARLENVIGRLDAGQVPIAPRPGRLTLEIERRRLAFRPRMVRLLFIVSPIPLRDPPDLTDFYLANAHLYRSIRAAFVLMEGEESIPTGDLFLQWFKDRGGWLVVLPGEARPERGRPSNRVRHEQMEYIRSVLADVAPGAIVTITPRVTRLVQEVLRADDLAVKIVAQAKVPRDLWKKPFANRLRSALAGSAGSIEHGSRSTRASGSRPRASLLADITRILDHNGNRRMRVYQIAEALTRGAQGRSLGEVQSGIRQVLKQHRAAFDKNGAGIRLAARAAGPLPDER